MERPPRDPEEALLSRSMLSSIGIYGAFLLATALGVFVWGLGTGSTERAGTLAFLTLGLGQTFHVFNARTVGPLDLSRIHRNGWVWGAVVLVVALLIAAVEMPALARMLETVPLGITDWVVLVSASFAPLVLGQAWKRFLSRKRSPTAEPDASLPWAPSPP